VANLGFPNQEQSAILSRECATAFAQSGRSALF
jgi:hypothetical protein